MSDRQRAVALRAQGLTYREIGRQLGVSRSTANRLAPGGKATPADGVEHDLQRATQNRWESRRTNPNFKTDPVWFGLRVPGTKPEDKP